MKRPGMLIGILSLLHPLAAAAQPVHEHAMPVNAVGGGVPHFCAQPTATVVADGRWSAPATWSDRRGALGRCEGPDPGWSPGGLRRGQRRHRAMRRGPRTDGVRHGQQHEVEDRHLLVMDGGVLEVGTPGATDRRRLARGDSDRGSADRHAPRSRTGRQRHRRPRAHQDARSGQDADLRAPGRRGARVPDDVRAGSCRARAGRQATGSSSRHATASRSRTRARLQVPRRAGRNRVRGRRRGHGAAGARVGSSRRTRQQRRERPPAARRQSLAQRRRRLRTARPERAAT